MSYLEQLGFQEGDAVFPKEKDLETLDANPDPVQSLSTSAAVNSAFKEFSEIAGKQYTPHCVRDTLAVVGEAVCRNDRERKAFSQNFGHESETITFRNYGKMSDQDQFGMMETLRERQNDMEGSFDEFRSGLEQLIEEYFPKKSGGKRD